MKRTKTSKCMAMVAGVFLSALIFTATPFKSMAYTQATGIVSADAAKVRKEPSTSSDAVVGLLKGSTVTIVDEVTDSAGAVWYKIIVDNSAGYIRSDLLIKASASTGTTAVTTGTTTATDNIQNTEDSKPAPTTATPIAETKAYINFESARIREGASTNHEIVGSATKNTVVTITGEAKANDGKKWYQIKYTTSAGREVVGFVRSDLVTTGDPPAEQAPAEDTAAEDASGEESAEGEEGAAEGENAEAPVDEAPVDIPAEEPEPETKPDYEMVYTQNNEGENEWYLYDNINGTRQTLTGLMAAAEAGSAQGETDSQQLSTQKIIIIILAVVAAILAVTVTLLLFKIKDLYDDDYDDEDDEDEEDEDEDDEEDEDEEEEEIPVRKRIVKSKPAQKMREREVQEPVRRSANTSAQVRVMEEIQEKEPTVSQPKRKAKNFLVDDDEFEFEFLNMDDKE